MFNTVKASFGIGGGRARLISHADVRSLFGDRFAEHLATVWDGNVTTAVACRHLLTYMVCNWQADVGQKEKLIQALTGAGPLIGDEVAYLMAMQALIDCWLADMPRDADLASTSAYHYGRAVVEAFGKLHRLYGSSYPLVERSVFKIPKGTGRCIPINELDWPEIDQTLCPGEKAIAALALVRRSAVDRYLAYHHLFQFGQALLLDKPHGLSGEVNEEARAVLRSILLSENARLLRGSRCENSLIDWELYAPARKPSVWCAAGLPAAFGLLGLVCTGKVLLPCLGATLRPTQLLAEAFICDTGWNLQSVVDMP